MNSSSDRKKRTIIRDPVHKFIDLSHYDFIVKIINTPYFQRTRRLSQLGVSLFVYPSATHSRFNHSLGAMEVFVRLFDHLHRDERKNNSYHNLRKTGIAAVLLHDIGHGPFSHASEKPLNFEHDLMSEEIVKTKEIRKILEEEQICVEDVLSIISRRAKRKLKLASQLINSQLDADRLDYLARDIYFTGVGFGGVDLERIIRTLTISKSKGFLNGYAVVEEKGKDSVEAYLLTRTLMYENVYYHKTTRSVECLLSMVISRVKDLYNEGKSSIPPELKFVERGNGVLNRQLNPEYILLLDDHSVYALLLRWSKNNDDHTHLP